MIGRAATGEVPAVATGALEAAQLQALRGGADAVDADGRAGGAGEAGAMRLNRVVAGRQRVEREPAGRVGRRLGRGRHAEGRHHARPRSGRRCRR